MSYTQPRHICSVQHANFSEIGTKSTRRRSISDIFKSNIQIQSLSRQEGVRACTQFFFEVCIYIVTKLWACVSSHNFLHTQFYCFVSSPYLQTAEVTLGELWQLFEILSLIFTDFEQNNILSQSYKDGHHVYG